MITSQLKLFRIQKAAGSFARYVSLMLIACYQSSDGRWFIDRRKFLELDGCDRWRFYHVMKKFRSMGIIKKEGNCYEIMASELS